MNGFVYAIGTSDTVKIGWARDPQRRLSELNIASPFPLTLIGYRSGGKIDETSAHIRCAAERIRGEWFRRSGTILEFIAGLTVAPPSAPVRIFGWP